MTQPHRLNRRGAVARTADVVPLVTTGVLAALTTAFYIGSLSDTQDLLALLYTSLAVALINGAYWLWSRPTNSYGLLTLHVGMLFWFYWSGVNGFYEAEGFDRVVPGVFATNRHFLTALVQINAFYVMLIVGYHLPSPKFLQRRLARVLGEGLTLSRRQILVSIVALIVAGFLFYLIASGGVGGVLAAVKGGRANSKAWSSEGNFGSKLSSLHFIFQGGLVVATNLAFYALTVRKDTRFRIPIAFMFITTVIYVALESGTRNTLMQCVMPAFLVYLRTVQQKEWALRLVHYGFMLTLVLAVAAFSVVQLHTRLSGDTTDIDLDEMRMTNDNDFLTETAIAAAVQEVRHEKLVYEFPSVLLATGMIPRYFWAGKPSPRVYVVYSLYRYGIDVDEHGGNALPSIVGQYYMSFGWFGVFEIGLLLGLLMKALDRICDTRKSDLVLLAAGFIFSYIFAVFRYISFGFFPPVIVMLSLVFVYRLRFSPVGATPAQQAS